MKLRKNGRYSRVASHHQRAAHPRLERHSCPLDVDSLALSSGRARDHRTDAAAKIVCRTVEEHLASIDKQLADHQRMNSN